MVGYCPVHGGYEERWFVEDERVVHHLVASLRFQFWEHQEFPYPLEKFCGADIVLIHEILLILEM